MTKLAPNFVALDLAKPDVAGLVAAMLKGPRRSRSALVVAPSGYKRGMVG